jgi:hypothetical protein
LGKHAGGRPGFDPQERETQKKIKEAIAYAEQKQRAKVLQDMAQYRKNRKRMSEKARAARLAGLSYGYYVALVLERRGRLAF